MFLISSCLTSFRIFRTLKYRFGTSWQSKKMFILKSLLKCSFAYFFWTKHPISTVEALFDSYFKWEYKYVNGEGIIPTGPNRLHFLNFHFYTFTALCPKPIVFIPVTRRVKGYTIFVGKYVTGRSVFDPIKYIYSWSGSLAESI